MVESSTPIDAAVAAEAGVAGVGVVVAADAIPAYNAAAAVVAYTTAAAAVEMCADAAGDAESGFVVICSSHKVI